MSTKLLPCPFCGSLNLIKPKLRGFEDYLGRNVIQCVSCKAEAITEIWNHRARVEVQEVTAPASFTDDAVKAMEVDTYLSEQEKHDGHIQTIWLRAAEWGVKYAPSPVAAAVAAEVVGDVKPYTAWLIERGSPAEYWVGNGNGKEEWTDDATKAQKFNEWGAKQHAKELEQWGVKGPLRACGHTFNCGTTYKRFLGGKSRLNVADEDLDSPV